MVANSVTVVRESPTNARKTRTPKHTFMVEAKPWQIQPFMIAPVLPGETMSSMLVQGIARGAPLKSDQLGWWFENYFFYVKHRDLVERDLVTQMHLDPATDLSSIRNQGTDPATSASTWTTIGAPDWMRMCRDVCIAEYFRDEGEGVLDAAIAGLPIANLNIDNFTDSGILNSAAAVEDHELPGENTELPDQGIPPGFEAAYAHWEHMRALQLYSATFEDYLKSFGVSPAKELQVNEIHKPELIRYVREWTYPQVKYDVDTQAAAPQMIVNISERADKDRFFSEPGFIIGLCVARPKVYPMSINGSGVGMLDNAYTWLPAVLDDAPYTSLKKFEAGTGPMVALQESYWIDTKDLFMHGDQFVAIVVPADPTGFTLPPGLIMGAGPIDGRIRPRYAVEADYAALFADAAKCTYRFEGVASLSIKSRLRDTSL